MILHYSNIIVLGSNFVFHGDLVHWRSDTPYFHLLFLIVSLCICVLGLARTGLIFTGLQEGAQLGGGG